jgi:tRNA nucleotidyltransferase/poly(A) polymerase
MLALPDPLLSLVARLEDAHSGAWLVGRCLRELLEGEEPGELEVATEACPQRLLALFPSAVVVAPHARRLMLPSAAGPIDLIPLETDIETELWRRDFRIHAIAYRPREHAWVDPCCGRDDLARGRLRTPRSADECLDADPVRALRAARLVSELALEVSPELETAMREIAPRFEKLLGRRLRVEIDALLLGPNVGRALELLARTGITASLAPGAAADGASVVPRLPRELELRLAGWLRGAPVRAVLRTLRCPRDRATRIERLLQMHPIDAGARAARESRARRLARQPEAEREALRALRTAELEAGTPDAGALARLAHLNDCLDRALRAREQTQRRASLALDGRAVMEQLGCGPGALVGRALRHLAAAVERDPALNRPESLRALLDAWSRDT